FFFFFFFFFFSDGLFGECSNSDSSVLVLFEQPETEHAEVLQSELANLKSAGYEWHHARTQCLLNYFKVVVVLSLPFKPGFCDEQNLDYALPLLQEILSDGEPNLSLFNEDVIIPAQYDYIDDRQPLLIREPIALFASRNVAEDDYENADEPKSGDVLLIKKKIPLFKQQTKDSKPTADQNVENTKKTFKDMINNRQLTLLGDLEEAVPLSPVEYESLPLKKDREHVDERYTGLDKVEHKIVKGDQELRGVDRNRVYVKVPEKITPGKLLKLMNYLQNSIAAPNKLIFDEFMYQEGQLSFRPSRMFSLKPTAEKDLNSVEGVAEAVCKLYI
ncbi:unnamed protein product, partial [Enterobius vermicularis]|uniref:UBX domain-containing protein n=1 Tax=Enterobius vermicularis TaxID=51028 RepID=A0A0N4VQV1_ENTVE